MSERESVASGVATGAGDPVLIEGKEPSEHSVVLGSNDIESKVQETKGGQQSVTSISKSSAGKEGDEDLEEQQRRLEARRAYNRMNAARARKRTKDRISDLCIKVEEQATINAKLKKTNKELMDRVDRLTDENRELRRIAMETRGLRAAAPEGTSSLFSPESPNQSGMMQAQLPASLVNVSGLFPLLQQNGLLGCMPGNGIPQLLSQADQQRLLRTHTGLQDLAQLDPSTLQASLLLQQNVLKPQASLTSGQDRQPSGQQYFDLVRSVLAGKLANEAPKEVPQAEL